MKKEDKKKPTFSISYPGIFISSLLHKGPQHLFPASMNQEAGGLIAVLGAKHPDKEDETPTTMQHAETSRDGTEHGSTYVYVEESLVLALLAGTKEWDVLFEGLPRKYTKVPLRFLLPALNYHRRLSLHYFLWAR